MGLWKEIRKGSLFFSKIVFIVDNGKRVHFRKDKWCTMKFYVLLFSSLYALVTSKGFWVGGLGFSGIGVEVEFSLS